MQPTPLPPTVNPVTGEIDEILSRGSELGVSVIRTTIVPPIAAAVVLVLSNYLGLELPKDDPTVTAIVFTAVTGGWYTVWRGVEVFARKPLVVKIAGFLLGSWKKPVVRSLPATPTAVDNADPARYHPIAPRPVVPPR